MNIYVGNLNYRVKEGDLQQVMEDYGAVSSVKVVMDRETGKSKGFAFIEMEDDAAAAKAIAELNGAEYMGRTMVVKEARPETNCRLIWPKKKNFCHPMTEVFITLPFLAPSFTFTEQV